MDTEYRACFTVDGKAAWEAVPREKCMWSTVDQNVVMQHMAVQSFEKASANPSSSLNHCN